MFSQEKVNEVLLLHGCALPSHHHQTSWYMRAMVCLQPWSCPDYITVRSTGPSRYRPTRQHHACAPDLLRLSDWKSCQCVVSLLVPGSCQSQTHAAASRTLVSQGKTQHFQHGKVWPNALFSFFFVCFLTGRNLEWQSIFFSLLSAFEFSRSIQGQLWI